MENVKIGKNEHTDCLLFLQLVTARSKTSSFVIGSVLAILVVLVCLRFTTSRGSPRFGSKIDAPF